MSRVDHSVKISLHQVSNDVNVLVIGLSLRFKDVEQPDDVDVLEKL